MAIGKASWCPAYGSMTRSQSSSPWWWTTWSQIHRQRTHTAPQEVTQMRLQKSPTIGQEQDTMASLMIGTTKSDKSIPPCPTMYAKRSNNSNTYRQVNNKTPLSKHSNKIWSQETICNRIVFGTTARCKRKKVHTAGMRKKSIPRTCG